MSVPHRMIGVYVMKTGHAVPIGPAQMELREAVGLESQPPTAQHPQNKEQLEQVQKLFRATNYDAMIDFDWDTMNLRGMDKGGKK